MRRYFNRERVVFSKNGAGGTGDPFERKKEMNLDPYLTPHTKINFKWITDVKVKVQTTRLVE